jgi:drug/metabolite transporter (DMT)-like permease
MKVKPLSPFIQLNLGLLFLSTSGVLGRAIDMSPTLIIWWRGFIATILMLAFIRLCRYSMRVRSKGELFIIILSGILLAAHWITYFYALALSSIAIALLTLHTYPAMTALLEPLMLKTRFRWYHLWLAMLIVVGVYILLPDTDYSGDISIAIVLGLVSALAYALRNIFTRKVIVHYNGSVMMLFQLIVITIVLMPILFVETPGYSSIQYEWPLILTLAIVTTCLGHTLFITNLKHYDTITISLLNSIVPVYGILWGVIFLGEHPSLKTVLGGSLILVAFIIESIHSAKVRKSG